MKVLLTGGTGFMGAWVTRALIEKKHKPVLYDLRSDLSLLEDVKGKLVFVQGDTLDLPSLIQVIKEHKVQRIIHAAALTSPPNPLKGVKVNIEGTINVFEAARLLDVKRVVFISSKAVYGAVTGDHAHPTYKPISEDYRKVPDSVYGATKLAAEFMASNYYKKYDLSIITLRFALIYGPGKSERYESLSLLGRIVENAVRGMETNITQGRDQKNDIVYIKDVADAILKACFKADLVPNIYNIGTGVGSTLLELADEVKKFYPQSVINIGPGVDYLGDNRNHYCIMDISRAKENLGYKPKFPLTQAVEDYINALRSC